MSIASLSPEQAHAALTGDPAVTYVDVRTVAEFAKGHPKGKVVNVPIVFFHPHTDAVFQNESFELVMAHACPKDRPLIIGCEHGPRARQAIERLSRAGYRDLRLMEAGHAGWLAARLPTTTDNRDGISYVSLLTPAKRQQKKAARKQKKAAR